MVSISMIIETKTTKKLRKPKIKKTALEKLQKIELYNTLIKSISINDLVRTLDIINQEHLQYS